LLILSRREGESVIIPDCRVEIIVKEISAGMVRLGFAAPDEVAIYREEIWKEMCLEDWNNRRSGDGVEHHQRDSDSPRAGGAVRD